MFDTYFVKIDIWNLSFQNCRLSDGILDFDRVDGDKIKIVDGSTPLATPFGSLTLTSDNISMPGYTVVKVTGTNEVVFGVNGSETFTDADVTVA